MVRPTDNGWAGVTWRATIYGRMASGKDNRVAVRGGVVRRYPLPKMKEWKEAVWAQLIPLKPKEPMDGPLGLKMIFYLPKNSGYRVRDLWPCHKPDVFDNLAGPIADCLEAVGVVRNDSRFCTVDTRKFFGEPMRVEIEVWEL